MHSIYGNKNITSEDYGVLFGYGLFETFHVNKQGNVFLLDRHIERLFHSLDFFGFKVDFDKQTLRQNVLKEIDECNIKNKVLRLTVTIGNERKGIRPSISFAQRDNPYDEKIFEEGCSLMISPLRKNAISSIIRHKTCNYLENLLENQKALAKGFDDAIFLNTDHEITETTKSNLFFVSDHILYTPDLSCGLLPGIIREWVLNEAPALGLTSDQGHFQLNQLHNADEIFVTNSVFGIIPIRRVENKVFDSGKATGLLIKQYKNAFC